MSHTVKLKKYQDINVEKVAAAAITPGMLMEVTSAGKVQAHSTESGNAAPKMFALEDELQGKSIDDDYAAADQVQCWIAQPGEVVNAILKDGETISIGDYLESAGDGTLKKYEADWSTSLMYIYPQQIVAQANAALDLSGSSGAEPTNRLSVTIV